MGIQLPPQAYTRDTMIQAYEWLQSQPASIREIANSPDALVSLFMQARRRGGAQVMNTHPVSSQAFKQDLKNLAEGLRQFEGQDDLTASYTQGPLHQGQPAQGSQHQGQTSSGLPHAPPANMQAATGATASPTVNVMVTPNYSQPNYQHMQPQQPMHSQMHQQMPQQMAPQAPMQSMHMPMQSAMTASPTNINETDDVYAGLDSKSHEMVRRVQSRFNLSGEKEALRMLIALGFDKVREMLPKG